MPWLHRATRISRSSSIPTGSRPSLGRNARFASIGNGLAAAVLGATGSWLSSRAVFVLTAALCVPALVALGGIGRGRHSRRQTTVRALDWEGLRKLLSDRRLLVFGVCVALFHLSNAAMLPLAASAITMRAGHFANLIIAACILVPQCVVALLSPWVGRQAAIIGRRPLLLLGWASLPVRGVLLAVLPGPWLLVAGQSISGISAAVFGVMLPLLAADLTRGTSHFNLCMGLLGLAIYLGAALSTTLGGWVADDTSTEAGLRRAGAGGAARDSGDLVGDAGDAAGLINRCERRTSAPVRRRREAASGNTA